MQAKNESFVKMGMFPAFAHIAKTEGIKGLWRVRSPYFLYIPSITILAFVIRAYINSFLFTFKKCKKTHTNVKILIYSGLHIICHYVFVSYYLINCMCFV